MVNMVNARAHAMGVFGLFAKIPLDLSITKNDQLHEEREKTLERYGFHIESSPRHERPC